jgi:uridine kinase
LAVRFVDTDSSGKGTVTARLEELRKLREGGLISDDEYQRRRREILSEL